MRGRDEFYALFTDPHVPYEDVKSCRAAFRYISDIRLDGVVIGGDMLDMDAISFWDVDKPGRKEGKRLGDEWGAGNGWLSRLIDAARNKNKRAKIWYLQGNHEFRVDRYIEKHPEQTGEMEVPVKLELDKKRVEWVRSWERNETVRIGKFEVSHGHWTNVHHAKKHVEAYGCNIFYGHTHSVQEFPLQYRGRDKTIVGASSGCMCNYELAYMRGRPNNWQQGFREFIVRPDGGFQDWYTKIFDHKFTGLRTMKTYNGN